MISDLQWRTLLNLKKSDFLFPDNLIFDVVQRLDRLITELGSRPRILSDYRPPNTVKSQHPNGWAIDTSWAIDPARVYAAADRMFADGGVGVYINEVGGVSFHFDTRGKRARWGGLITRPVDPDTGRTVKRIDYVGLEQVWQEIKKKAIPASIALGIFALILWLIVRR